MNTKKKPDIQKSDMAANPFIANQIIKARAFNKEEHYVIQVDDGVNLINGTIKNYNLVEEQKSTKIYHDVSYRDLLFTLKERPLKLLLYIMYQIEPNEDYIWINNVHFQDHVKCNKKDYREAVESLIDSSVLACCKYSKFSEVYYINPLIFFCGNRLKKYPDNVKIRK